MHQCSEEFQFKGIQNGVCYGHFHISLYEICRRRFTELYLKSSRIHFRRTSIIYVRSLSVAKWHVPCHILVWGSVISHTPAQPGFQNLNLWSLCVCTAISHRLKQLTYPGSTSSAKTTIPERLPILHLFRPSSTAELPSRFSVVTSRRAHKQPCRSPPSTCRWRLRATPLPPRVLSGPPITSRLYSRRLPSVSLCYPRCIPMPSLSLRP